MIKNTPASTGEAGDAGLIPWLGRSLGVGNGHSFQYSCLQNPMDRGAWQAIVHGVAKSWTRLSMHALIMQLFFFLKGNKTILLGFWFKNFH